MNNSKTPKIVIGVGLAAIYAAGLGFFVLRGAHDKVIAQTSTASSSQVAADAVSSTGIAPASPDLSTSVVDQPGAVGAAAEKVAGAAPKADASPARGESETKSSPASAGTSEVGEPATTAGNSPSPVQATSTPAGNDNQITADVKSQIEAVAPAGAIDVTTRDGVVELTGSVPSEEVINKALLAARNVPDVRDVDVSALTISN